MHKSFSSSARTYYTYAPPFAWQLPQYLFTSRYDCTNTYPVTSFPRRVSFATTPIYSRLPRDDELYVMKTFARHTARCAVCATGNTLCAGGKRRALDVAQYIYVKEGKAYSTIDRISNQRVQIEIPVGCEAVHLLLQAGQELSIMQNNSSAKPIIMNRQTTHSRKPIETADSARQHPVYASESYQGRGGLYEAELRERAANNKPIIYHRFSIQRPPPVWIKKVNHW